jgi:hypothetical protein
MGTTQTVGSSLYDSGLSNTEILDKIGMDIVEPSAKTDDTPPTDATADSTKAAETTTTDVVRPEWFEAAPAEVKAILDHKNVSAETKKWFETHFGEHLALKESPLAVKETLEEIGNLFPGGVDEMKDAIQNAQEFAQEMAQFRSGDPNVQAELLGKLVTEDPDAFVSMVGAAAQMLKQTLRDDYTSFSAGVTKEHLDNVTDGMFATFFDGVAKIAEEYEKLNNSPRATDEIGQKQQQEQIDNIVSRLAGYALKMASWWPNAKGKLGYGAATASAAESGVRPAVVRGGTDPNSPEMVYARKDAGYFQSDYAMKHDHTVGPMIQAALTRDLKARKLEDLPRSWQQDVFKLVDQRIKQTLAADKAFVALENRLYKRGALDDPRKWDNREPVKQQLLSAAKQRAEKLIPSFLKQALDRIVELRGSQKSAAAAGAGTRTGTTTPAAGGGTGKWEDELKEGKIDNLTALQRMAGIS